MNDYKKIYKIKCFICIQNHKYKLILIIILLFINIKIIIRIIIKIINSDNFSFINLCYDNILINNDSIPNILHTKISVIIPVYNGENYLNYSLNSVLNQRMKEIEIIIINDNSNDNSSKVIHKYMEKDKRIKLIENNVNRKIFYSKSIGALNSKGKYIIELDQDDMFISDKAFDIIYNESEKYNLDLLSFGFISGKNIFQKLTEKKCKYKKNNIIIENQPKIKYSMFKTITGLLWGHLIKADLYKKILYHLWPIIINYKIIFQEDYLILFFIAIYAKNHTKIVDKLLFHFINNKSASDKYENNLEYYLSLIFSGHIFYDYYIDYYS